MGERRVRLAYGSDGLEVDLPADRTTVVEPKPSPRPAPVPGSASSRKARSRCRTSRPELPCRARGRWADRAAPTGRG
ncbi:hypothetical protein ACFPM0_32420 [Pseudonocardia sulfidoxydans]|uniref:hypothetical protein n=1 Tax=Pseudonocardia sulfidoxydans TaxID=54011 RepID=UPI0011BF98EF